MSYKCTHPLWMWHYVVLAACLPRRIHPLGHPHTVARTHARKRPRGVPYVRSTEATVNRTRNHITGVVAVVVGGEGREGLPRICVHVQHRPPRTTEPCLRQRWPTLNTCTMCAESVKIVGNSNATPHLFCGCHRLPWTKKMHTVTPFTRLIRGTKRSSV